MTGDAATSPDGRTLHSHGLQLRLRAARRLLAGGMSAARVAAEVGFADQAHLTRWFRRCYGLTPGAYSLACQ
jgi:AraC-like DNA-binding protein